MATKEEVLTGLSPADKEALTGILQGYKADGVADPKLPLDYDVEGDGKPTPGRWTPTAS